MVRIRSSSQIVDFTAAASQGFILEKRIGVGRNPCHGVGESPLSPPAVTWAVSGHKKLLEDCKAR